MRSVNRTGESDSLFGNNYASLCCIITPIYSHLYLHIHSFHNYCRCDALFLELHALRAVNQFEILDKNLKNIIKTTQILHSECVRIIQTQSWIVRKILE